MKVINVIFNKYLVKNKAMILWLFIMGTLADLFLLPFVYTLVFISLAVLWLLCVYLYKIKDDWHLRLSIALLILVALLALFDLQNIAEKIAIWAYFFLVIAFFRRLKDEKVKGRRISS